MVRNEHRHILTASTPFALCVCAGGIKAKKDSTSSSRRVTTSIREEDDEVEKDSSGSSQ